jgi:HK97 family phage prohead protease
MDAPKHDLYRSAPPAEVRADDSGKLTLYGHFSVFDTPTEINSVYEGRFIERIAPGAFKKTFAERGDRIKIMWNHGRSEILPDVLIAKPKIVAEDERGAYYEAEMFSGLPEWLYEGLRAQVYGASFRFQAHDEDWNEHPGRSDDNPEGLPERIVRTASVAEAGPVSWPAYEAATSAVRSLSDRFHDLATSTARAADQAPGVGDAGINPQLEAGNGAVHLGPTSRERRMRSLDLRGITSWTSMPKPLG